MSSGIAILAPGLLGEPFFAPAIKGVSLPALDDLFAGVIEALPAAAQFEQQLINLLGGRPLGGAISLAHLLSGQDGAEHASGCYLLASLVHLQADSGRLVMYGEDGLDITQEEAEQWLEELSPVFKDHAIEAYMLSPECWLLHLAQAPGAMFTPLSEVIGRNIHDYMPVGEEGLRWRSLINEVQMQFHQSDVNRRRQRYSLKPVNSLWFWGAGEPGAFNRASWQSVSSDSALVRKLARCAGVKKQFSLAADMTFDFDSDYQLSVVTALAGASARQDMDAWCQCLQWFNDRVAEPVVEALNSRQLKEAQIYPVNGYCYRIRRTRRLRWFGKKRRFVSYVNDCA